MILSNKTIVMLFLAFTAVTVAHAQKSKEQRTNITFLMVDDMRYSDIGAYGSEIQTTNSAVRQGKWKLIPEQGKRWELYDLEADRGETADLANVNPDEVRSLSFECICWSARTGVIEYETLTASSSESCSGSNSE